jgi:hypothetical protein
MPIVVTPPETTEYADFHRGYIAAVSSERDGVALLERQRSSISTLRGLHADQAGHRYAPGKWSVKEVIGHLSDSERVLSYRLMRIARGDTTPLPGFDENAIAAGSNADRRDIRDLGEELAAVRASTLALVRSLDDEALLRHGTVREWSMSARAIVFVIAGHFAHHLQVLRDRYGIYCE